MSSYKTSNCYLYPHKHANLIGYMQDKSLCPNQSDFMRDALEEFWANHPELEQKYLAKHHDNPTPRPVKTPAAPVPPVQHVVIPLPAAPPTGVTQVDTIQLTPAEMDDALDGL